jgi:hypothetical protein
MQDVTTYWTWKITMKTPTITPASGASTEESNERQEKLLGDLTNLLRDDPYWGICIKLWRLLSRKRGYYGCKKSPLENALGVADDGITPWKYQVARIGEKCRRLRGSLRTIDIRETLMDIAGHAVVAVACLDHEVDHEFESSSVASGAPRPSDQGA